MFESRGLGRVETKSKFSFLEEFRVANVLYGGLGQGWTISEGGHIDKGLKPDWGSWGKGGGGGKMSLVKRSFKPFQMQSLEAAALIGNQGRKSVGSGDQCT